MRMPRHVAPSGAPIRLLDLARWASSSLPFRDAAGSLQQQVRDRFGVRHAFLISTGRAGMTLLFQALRRLAPANRNEVLLPSYTCFSVAASAVKAGLKVRLADLNPETLDYNLDELERVDFTNVLAMVATNLYGLPNDMAAIAAIARDRGVFLVDDAAQSMGAVAGGRLCGTWGDAGIFSFDKGKNVPAIDGGIVVTNSDRVGAAMAAECEHLAGPGLAASGAAIAKALVYAAMLRPSLYWIPNSIPQLELGKTVFTTVYPLERSGKPLVALAATMLPRVNAFTAARVANAEAMIEGLRGMPGIRVVRPLASVTPAYLRLPILVANSTFRSHLLSALNQAGVGATGSYPASLADVDDLRPWLAESSPRADGGRQIARQIVTLPTHAFVGAADIEKTIATMQMINPKARTCAA
jgi:perosamine synthetase